MVTDAEIIANSPLVSLTPHSPLNSVWEGSGNVMALDVLRAFQKGGAETYAALVGEHSKVKGMDEGVDGFWSGALRDVEALGKVEGEVRSVRGAKRERY